MGSFINPSYHSLSSSSAVTNHSVAPNGDSSLFTVDGSPSVGSSGQQGVGWLVFGLWVRQTLNKVWEASSRTYPKQLPSCNGVQSSKQDPGRLSDGQDKVQMFLEGVALLLQTEKGNDSKVSHGKLRKQQKHCKNKQKNGIHKHCKLCSIFCHPYAATRNNKVTTEKRLYI